MCVDEERSYLIYKYTSPSGKSYIGQTKNDADRTRLHKAKNSGCPLFKAAIDKYGFENMNKDILETGLTLKEANIRESFYIAKFNTLAPNGYNLTTGGDNTKVSEESKKKMSEKRIGEKNHFFGKVHSEAAKNEIGKASKGRNDGSKNFMFGKTHTEEARLKISNSRLGKKASDADRKKMSESRKGELNHNYGKTHSAETRAKISAKVRGRTLSEEHKRKISESLIRRYNNKTPTSAE